MQGNGQTILVVDDEEDVREVLIRLLELDGYTVVVAGDGKAAIEAVDEHSPDLVLLDVTLPEVDGLDVLNELRQTSDVPVIFLTGRGLEADRVIGLKMGADDYMVKPFSSAELTVRIETVLRRARGGTGPEPEGTTTLEFGPLTIDVESRDVVLGGNLIVTTAREFDLLAFLARSPRQVFTRDQLLAQVWGSSSQWQSAATVTEHIRRLRRKIEDDSDRPRWITTVRGVGYRFEP